MTTNYEVEELKMKRSIIRWITFSIILVLCIILGFMMGCPRYNVYSQRLEGEALLAHSMASKEVAVSEARAKLESATLLSQADTIRALGIAKSNKIIGTSLTEAYLHWFWIDGLEKNQNSVIYVATEANIPIMEANRFNKQSNDNNKK